MTSIAADAPRPRLDAEPSRRAGEEATRAALQATRPLDPSVVQATADAQQTRGEQARPVTGAPTSARWQPPALPGSPASSPSQRAIEAARTPQGQEALRQVQTRNETRLMPLGESITSRSPREHAAEFARGLKDGVKDTVGGLYETGKLAVRLATDSAFRADVARGATELREAMRTPEGRSLVGRALGDGGDAIVAEISRNPAYAAGFVAGSLVTGGPIMKAISAASKLGSAGRLVDKGRQAVAGHGLELAIGAGVVGAGVIAGTALGRDVARTAAEAPFASINAAALAVRGRTRILAAGGREHLRQQAEAQRPPPAPAPVVTLPPVDGSSHWLYAP